MSEWCFFIGPGKTGSTWLYNNLVNHPEIKLPKNIKESNYYFEGEDLNEFFNIFFNYGNKKKINMDISNTYIYDKSIVKKLKKNHPNSKIIIGHREPVERLKSMYLFKQRNGDIPQNVSLSNSLENDAFNLISHSKYYELSLPYLIEFGFNNIFIFDFEKMKNTPEILMKELQVFIGVSEVLEKDKLSKITNPASSYRIKYLSKYSKFISNFLRKNKFYFILNYIKSNVIIQKFLFKKIDHSKQMLLNENINEFKSIIRVDYEKFKSIFLN